MGFIIKCIVMVAKLVMFTIFTVIGGPIGFVIAFIISLLGGSRSRHKAELKELRGIKKELAAMKGGN